MMAFFHQRSEVALSVMALDYPCVWSDNRSGSPGRMEDQPWWRGAVIYEIYPRSFADSDGDGLGDLEGIRRNLDYLQWLGVDALWLCPFYPSPLADGGYDIADYCDVDPRLGTLEDFDRLLADAHE